MATVLVVEDDDAILESVAYNLARDGHEVLTASDGISGLAVARDRTPDLVVLDVMLPRMSGLDVCRILRDEQAVPIILLTARDAEADKVQGLELGADDYVTKPFSMRELRARVASQLRRVALTARGETSSAPAGDVLTAAGLELDLMRHELRRDGGLIALRPREFELLEYLMRNQGRVLSREQILESVWGYTYTGETRTVDVHVRWLRQKLEEDPSRPRHLLTVRNVGYKFEP